MTNEIFFFKYFHLKFYKTVDHIIKIVNSLIGFLNDIFNRIKFHDKTKMIINTDKNEINYL
ncbi:hypothetical protein BpHYR1_021533 [Brachionus plicatilis]|uniref:Uncharacterized protein n=1 Tax=Brachionus plicatilis TaxID=10195 RepID=A0A3M7SF54_BRAPC|nr:hypothetical protein BpHYR1_021533 [Brachionus plicatilis]